jgi:hypothetical protein
MEPVVEEWLAAAGLRRGKMDAAPEMLEDFCDRHADVRLELIREAGDEQGDISRHTG